MKEQYFMVLCHDEEFKKSACGIDQDILAAKLMRFIIDLNIFAILNDHKANLPTCTT